MCQITDVGTLHALLCASPRFYQVFRTRKQSLLTELAIQHNSAPANAWDALKASRLPKPPSSQDVETFIQTFWDDMGYQADVIPLEDSIPLIKMRACVDWFTMDLTQDCMANMLRLGELINLQQDPEAPRHLQLDPEATQRGLSDVEMGRIARAFYRFETFRHLFASPRGRYGGPPTGPQPAVEFLKTFDLDGVEEIACVRDYVVRKLCHVFDAIEDAFVRGELITPYREVTNYSEYDNWFGEVRKGEQDGQMEYLMSLGLPFLRELFTATPAEAADVVLSNNVLIGGFLSDTLRSVSESIFDMDYQPLDSVKECYYRATFDKGFLEDQNEYSMGWCWNHHWDRKAVPARRGNNGLRDWGYVFWERRRMKAFGVLEQS